jgi:hypothetical protein
MYNDKKCNCVSSIPSSTPSKEKFTVPRQHQVDYRQSSALRKKSPIRSYGKPFQNFQPSVVRDRSAGFKRESFELAPTVAPTPDPIPRTSITDFGNAVIPNVDSEAYKKAVISFYDSIGYPNFQFQNVGYDFSGPLTSQLQIPISKESFQQLPSSFQENFRYKY